MRLAPICLVLGGCVFTPPSYVEAGGDGGELPIKDAARELDASTLDAAPIDADRPKRDRRTSWTPGSPISGLRAWPTPASATGAAR